MSALKGITHRQLTWAQCRKIFVHPTVLLGVVDHHQRLVSGSRDKRVVGALLGTVTGTEVHITNSYAVPFEEDTKDSLVWYLDHTYCEDMYMMSKKINVREKVVGWYATGSCFKSADLDIHEVFRRWSPNPIHILIDARATEKSEFPVTGYICVEEAHEHLTFSRTFVHVPVHYTATEAEEVGVEHLQRDMRSCQTTTMSSDVVSFVKSMGMLAERLQKVEQYLLSVIGGDLPVNQSILHSIQESFNSLPTLDEGIVEMLQTHTQDAFLTLYAATMVRTVLAVHKLVDAKTTIARKEVST